MILTSVEFDHADLYRDLDAVKDAFRKGLALVPPDGLIVAHGADPNVRDVLSAARAPVLLYRLESEGERTDSSGLVARDVSFGPEGSRFTVHENGVPLFAATVPLSGRHNVANALAAIGAARPFGLSTRELAAGLSSFGGVKRRLEIRGTVGGVTVVDDFAHHPTAVGETIRGARDRFPGRRLWAVFEPRSITGGRADFAEAYRTALSAADSVALARPFHAARLDGPSGPGALDTGRLASELTRAGIPSFDAEGADLLAANLLLRLLPGDVVLVMSSGSFGGMCGKLLAGLGAPPPA